jgi:hypothetical protein
VGEEQQPSPGKFTAPDQGPHTAVSSLEAWVERKDGDPSWGGEDEVLGRSQRKATLITVILSLLLSSQVVTIIVMKSSLGTASPATFLALTKEAEFGGDFCVLHLWSLLLSCHFLTQPGESSLAVMHFKSGQETQMSVPSSCWG